MRTLHPAFGVAFAALPETRILSDALHTHALVVVHDTIDSDDALVACASALGVLIGGVKRFSAEGPSPDQSWHHVGMLEGEAARATVLNPEHAAFGAPGMQFVSMRAAWQASPNAERERLRGLTAQHVFRAAPERTVSYPLVFAPHDPAAAALFLGYHATAIDGQSDDEARALLDSLMTAATQPSRIYTHAFQAGELVIWDNRALMHRSCALPAGARRVVREVAIR